MKSKLYCFLALTFTTSCCFCQEKTEIINLTKITFLNPGIGREISTARLQSIYLQVFLNTSAYFSWSSTLGTNGGVYFDPALTIQYRYYYNSARRTAKGKRTETNNLNYLGSVLQTVFSNGALSDKYVHEENRRPINSIGAVWGIQRNGRKRFSFDLNLGIGYVFAKGTKYDVITGSSYSSPVSQFTTLGQLNLGFWVNQRK